MRGQTSLRGTLPVSACADNYRSRRYDSCVGCAIGREHAGEEAVGTKSAPPPPPVVPRMCIRCGQTGMTAERLIGRLRRVRAHTICVSCYNREREVVRGVNAKGATPKKIGARPEGHHIAGQQGQRSKSNIHWPYNGRERDGGLCRALLARLDVVPRGVWGQAGRRSGDKRAAREAPGEKSKPARQRVPKRKVAVPVHGFAARFGLQ